MPPLWAKQPSRAVLPDDLFSGDGRRRAADVPRCHLGSSQSEWILDGYSSRRVSTRPNRAVIDDNNNN